jgi:hypothetical protein
MCFKRSSSCCGVVLMMSWATVAGGCASKAGTGALIGGAGGAAAGGAIGSTSHARAGEGALIGGAVGAIGGALVGHSMDENDKLDRHARLEDADRDFDRRNGGAFNGATIRDNGVSKHQVVNWTDQGVRDDIIIDRIERSGTVFRLTAADQNELREQGVSESVIRAMRDTARR